MIILRYSRNAEYSNYCWKVPKWNTPLGGPPRGPTGPPSGPRVSKRSGKNCKNFKKLYKKFTRTKIPQIITLSPILGNLVFWGGPWGLKVVFGPSRGVFRKRERWFFFQLFSIGPLKRFWGVAMSDFDFTHLSIHPNHMTISFHQKNW